MKFDKNIVIHLLVAGLVVFLAIGTGQILFNYLSISDLHNVLIVGVHQSDWPSKEFVENLRQILLRSFLFALISLLAVLIFIFIDIFWKSKTRKSDLIKSIIQIFCGIIVVSFTIAIIFTFSQFTNGIPARGRYLFYPYTFAMEAQSLLFIPIICLVSLLFIMIPLSIIRLVKSCKEPTEQPKVQKEESSV